MWHLIQVSKIIDPHCGQCCCWKWWEELLRLPNTKEVRLCNTKRRGPTSCQQGSLMLMPNSAHRKKIPLKWKQERSPFTCSYATVLPYIGGWGMLWQCPLKVVYKYPIVTLMVTFRVWASHYCSDYTRLHFWQKCTLNSNKHLPSQLCTIIQKYYCCLWWWPANSGNCPNLAGFLEVPNVLYVKSMQEKAHHGVTSWWTHNLSEEKSL